MQSELTQDQSENLAQEGLSVTLASKGSRE